MSISNRLSAKLCGPLTGTVHPSLRVNFLQDFFFSSKQFEGTLTARSREFHATGYHCSKLQVKSASSVSSRTKGLLKLRQKHVAQQAPSNLSSCPRHGTQLLLDHSFKFLAPRQLRVQSFVHSFVVSGNRPRPPPVAVRHSPSNSSS